MKEIIGYKGYFIYDNGTIYSSKFKRFLKLQTHKKTGYSYVCLCNKNIKKTFSIHRLVAISFIPNPKNKLCVNHINGIKIDNTIENLEWVTHSENEIHSYKIGLKCFDGMKSHRAILNDNQVIEIKNRIKNGEKNITICKDYPVINKTISDIRRNKRWKHIKI
jgi:hypothetical protein